MNYEDYEADDLLELTADGVKVDTDKAVLFIFDTEEVWLPKSQIQYFKTDKGKYLISCPEWLVEEKELDFYVD